MLTAAAVVDDVRPLSIGKAAARGKLNGSITKARRKIFLPSKNKSQRGSRESHHPICCYFYTKSCVPIESLNSSGKRERERVRERELASLFNDHLVLLATTNPPIFRSFPRHSASQQQQQHQQTSVHPSRLFVCNQHQQQHWRGTSLRRK